MKLSTLTLLAVLLLACELTPSYYILNAATNELFAYQDRINIISDSSVALINSGASVSFTIVGDSISIFLSCSGSLHNYVALTVNNEYRGRIRIEPEMPNTIPLIFSPSDTNRVQIYKATESSNGIVFFNGVSAEKQLPHAENEIYSLEFIGNSITCGMGADTTDVPCGNGLWFDQHNAFLSYGARVATSLNASFMLNSVSGIGVYRNWNDENLLEPVINQVYENLYLNADTTIKYGFDFKPDIISICLGTNDLSDGDGIKKRLPFNKEKFIENYTELVAKVLQYHPHAKIVLLTSPMISGVKGDLLIDCLRKVKFNFQEDTRISIFEFEPITPTGCDFHPIGNEHEKMANQLIPFYNSLLKKM